MPDEDLSQCFDAIIDGVQEPLVRKYLEDAAFCFKIGVYNGAGIFAWNAASCYIRQVIEVISLALFDYNYYILFGEETPSDRQRINDFKLLQTCKGMGLLSDDMVVTLNRLRDCRNDCAHPSGIFLTERVAFDLVAGVSDFISRKVNDENLKDIGILKKFVKSAGEQDAEKIAPWIKEDLCPELAHKLLDMYLKDDIVEDVSGIEGIWHQIWKKLDESQKQHLWDHLVRAAKDVLEDESLRTPDELAHFIVWPPSDDTFIARDEIGRLYVEWFDRRIEENDFRAIDMDLARWLRDHLPLALSEKLQRSLEEMTRRYVE